MILTLFYVILVGILGCEPVQIEQSTTQISQNSTISVPPKPTQQFLKYQTRTLDAQGDAIEVAWVTLRPIQEIIVLVNGSQWWRVPVNATSTGRFIMFTPPSSAKVEVKYVEVTP